MECDLFLFAGQSNMAGRGITSPRFPDPAPDCLPGAGYEFRAISDPTRLYPITEPFGAAENNPGGIYEPGMKTGSLTTAFVNAYYGRTGIPVVGVSAAKGGSSILQWQPGAPFLEDAVKRFRAANDYLVRNSKVRHRFLLWCQGETDGDHAMLTEDYISYFTKTLNAFLEEGLEHCFLIQIGHYNGGEPYDYSGIIAAQRQIAAEDHRVTMVSVGFEGMRERGLMKDAFHYFQQAYNEVGEEAGVNTAEFVKGRAERDMED